MDVSVLMCIYREPTEYVRKAIESILTQTYRNYEFIIVIDDPECKRLIELVEQYKGEDERIIIIRNPTNMGLTKSLNIGLQNCKGEYIVRMDADDISLPHRIEKQVYYMKSHPSINASGTYAYVIDENDSVIGKKKTPVNIEEASTQCLFCTPLIHPASIIRRVVNGKPIQYDEKLRYSQDFGLWSSLPFGTISNIPEYHLRYRETSSQISTKNRDAQMACAKRVQKGNLDRLGIVLEDNDARCYEALINGDTSIQLSQSEIIAFQETMLESIAEYGNARAMYKYIVRCYVWLLYKKNVQFWRCLRDLLVYFYKTKGVSVESVILTSKLYVKNCER